MSALLSTPRRRNVRKRPSPTHPRSAPKKVRPEPSKRRVRPQGKDGSVQEYLESWLEGKRALRPTTRTEYARHIDSHFIPTIGSIPLGRLTPMDVDDLFVNLATGEGGQGMSPATLHRVHATLHSALATAVRRGLIRRNPASTVELPEPTRFRARTWTPAQAAQFLASIEGDEHYLVYRLLLLIGLRRGELIALRWNRLNPATGALQIDSTISLSGAKIIEGPPKSKNGHRQVYLDKETLRLLNARQRALVAMYQGQGMTADEAEALVAGEFIFPSPNGDCLSPAFVSRRFTRLTKKAGLPVIRLHDLRHTSASVALANGESLLQVSRRLGHSGIGITADIYSHVSAEVATMAANTMAQHLTSTGSRA